MKKSLLASAIALSIGSTTSVHALTIIITEMDFNASLGVAGTMNDSGNGSMTGTEPFLGANWTADQQSWFDTHSSVSIWSSTGTSSNTTNAIDDFTYTFHLTGNQVAAGTFFDWNDNINIPILTIYDCPATGGGACVGTSLPIATFPILGFQPAFNGTTNDAFPVSGGAVPVPAAVWLMGSGLIGLVGFARRKKA